MRHFFFNDSSLFITLLLIFFSNNSLAIENNNKPISLQTGFLLKSFPDIQQTEIEVALKYWTSELSKQTEIPATTHIYKNIKEMKLAFEKGDINFIVTSPLIFIDNFDLQQLTDGYKVYAEESTTEDLLIITNKDSNINNITDFKNRHLSLLSHDKISEMFVNTLTLDHFNNKAKSVLGSIDHEYKSPQLIYKLFFKQTDIIVVYRRAYQLAIELNPQIKKKTQIIYKLPNMLRGVGFFHKNVNPYFRELIISKLINIHTSVEGQQLLNIFFAERLNRSNLKDLNNTLNLKHKYEKLIKKRNFSY